MDGRSNRSAYSNQLPPPSAPLPPGRIAVNKLETDGIEHMRLGELAEAERDLMAVIPKPHWIVLSHRLIEHGRTVCLSRRPRCEGCLLADLCPRVGLQPATSKQ